MRKLAAHIIGLMLLISMPLQAQFYTSGQDDGGLKWYRLRTQYYDILYPQGVDSLAREYAAELSKWRDATGRSIGVVPGGRYRKPTPVVLRTQTANANGMVVWTPSRMEFYTVPDPYSPEPMVWQTELAIHEGRHTAQMQVGRQKGLRWTQVLVGQLSTAAYAGLYGGPVLFEGDAVTTETALSNAGRGRSADFLDYMMISADQGQWRGFWQWRYGSLTRYTPDYYRAGYVLVAGMRTTFDDPLFTLKFYDNIHTRKPWLPFFNLQYTVKNDSGLPLRKAWDAIGEDMLNDWRSRVESREPFVPSRQLTSTPKHFTQYSGTVSDGKSLLAISSGLFTSRSLVKIDLADGSVTRLRPWAASTSDLKYSDGRLYWSESIPDIRWEMKSDSRIRTMDNEGRIKDLTKGGRYYNPAPSPDGSLISVTEYPQAGGSAVVLLKAADGEESARWRAPGHLQVTETAWAADRLLACAISQEGAGIYDVQDDYSVVLKPIPMKIKQLRSVGDRLRFVCDRDGVNELYELQEDGSVLQLSHQRYGGSDFIAFGDSLYFSGLNIDGRMVYSAAADGRQVDWDEVAHYAAADTLSAQESRLADLPPSGGDSRFVTPKVERYRRLPHAFRIHSWAPVSIDVDNVSSLSFDQVYQSAGLGATAFFQSTLGESYGSLGYSVSHTNDRWYHALHARFTYTALWPVIELSADVGGRQVRSYEPRESDGEYALAGARHDIPSVSGSVKAYVPLNLSSGGVNRGVVPQIQWTFSNDVFNTSLMHYRDIPLMIDDKYLRQVTGYEVGRDVLMQRLSAKLRGYSMLSVAPSAIYPRWGIGAEVGHSLRPGITKYFNTSTYTYLYGYVPGFVEGHGVKLTALAQIQSHKGAMREPYCTTTPRGFEDGSELLEYLSDRFRSQTLFSAEYAFAAVPLDCSVLGPLAYIRNLEFAIHAEAGYYFSPIGSTPNGTLTSLGGQVAFRLGNLLWIPYGAAIGVTYSYNSGSLFDSLSLSHHHFGLVFSMDI